MLSSNRSSPCRSPGTNQSRLDTLYDKIESVEDEISELQTRIDHIMQQKISGDQVYQFLLYFDRLYDRFTDAEKRNS